MVDGRARYGRARDAWVTLLSWGRVFYHVGRAMIEKHLAGQAVKKSDFSTERKLYILKLRFLDPRHRPGCSGLVPRAHFCCGVPPGPKEK